MQTLNNLKGELNFIGLVRYCIHILIDILLFKTTFDNNASFIFYKEDMIIGESY